MMRTCAKLLSLLLLSALAVTAQAADPPATEASIRELLDITRAQRLMTGMSAQIDSVMQASIKQSLGNQTLTPSQTAILDDMRRQMIAVMQEDMRWEAMEPMFIDIYRTSLTESEVAGMIGFYKTPAGQAVIDKMPLILQTTMQAMQAHMQSMMPKLQQIGRDTAAKLKACCQSQTAPASKG